MKKQIPFITGLLAVLLFSRCQSYDEKLPQDHLLVYTDISDHHEMVSELTANHLFKFVRLDSVNYCYGAEIIIKSVSHLRHTRDYTFELEPVSIAESNALQRRKQIKELRSQVEVGIQKLKVEKVGTSHSYILFNILSGIQQLSQAEGQKTILVVSDLAENSKEFSVFKEHDWNLIIQEPEKAEALIDSIYSAKNINAIGVHLILAHRPQTQDEDDRFHRMGKFISLYMEKKGVKTTVTSAFQ